MYDILLAPVRPFVPAGSHIVLVPDGPLHALNVETLRVFDESPHYFIEDATVTVAPVLNHPLRRARYGQPGYRDTAGRCTSMGERPFIKARPVQKV